MKIALQTLLICVTLCASPKTRAEDLKCDEPPPDVYTAAVGAQIDAKIPALKKLAADVGLSLTRKIEKLRETLPGVHDFDVLEFRFCKMRRRGDITLDQYWYLVQKVLPNLNPTSQRAPSEPDAASAGSAPRQPGGSKPGALPIRTPLAELPSDAVQIRLNVSYHAEVKERQSPRISEAFYFRTPGNDCVRATPFDAQFNIPQGEDFVSATANVTEQRGQRTVVGAPERQESTVHVKGTVQGDDGFGGFCKNPGEIRFTIAITTDKWVEKSSEQVQIDTGTPKANQRSFAFQTAIPAELSSGRNLVASYAATVVRFRGRQKQVAMVSDAIPVVGPIRSAVNTKTGMVQVVVD